MKVARTFLLAGLLLVAHAADGVEPPKVGGSRWSSADKDRFRSACKESVMEASDIGRYWTGFCEKYLDSLQGAFPSLAAMERAGASTNDAIANRVLDSDPKAYSRLMAAREKQCQQDGGTPAACKCATSAWTARWPKWTSFGRNEGDVEVARDIGAKCRSAR